MVGGLVLAKVGLSRKTLMFFVGSLLIPNLAFVYLGRSQPDAFLLITVVWCVAMFAYGFGAVAHMYYMMKQISPGPYQTAHYAFATGTMGLCNFSAGFFSGKLADALGYPTFFTVVLFCAIPGPAPSILPSSTPTRPATTATTRPASRCCGRAG